MKQQILRFAFLVLILLYGINVISQEHRAYRCDESALICFEKYRSKHFDDLDEYLIFVKHIHERLQKEEKNLADYSFGLLRIATDISYISYSEAYPYIYELSLNLPQLEKIGFTNLDEAYKLSSNTAFYFRNYGLAERHAKKVLLLKNPKVTIKISCLNTLGLIARTNQKADSACYYFSKALQLAKRNDIKEWTGVVAGNLGVCRLKKGELEQAENLLKEDYSLSKETGDIMSSYMAYIALAEIDLLQGNLHSANDRLNHLYDTIPQNKTLQNDILSINLKRFESMFYEKIGQPEKALLHFKESQRLREKNNLMREQHDLEKMEFQIRFQKKMREQEIEKSQRLLKNTVIGAIIFSLILAIAYILLLLKKRQSEHIWLIKEDQRKEEDLQEAHKYIEVIKSFIKDKNRTINQLQEQMSVINATSLNSEIQSITLQQIENLLNSVVLTEEDWIQFKRRFKKIYPTFITKLMKLNPSLTNAEIRLACLIKLDLNTTEISNTLGISADSVRKTNLRLRNKLSLKKQEELALLINNLN